MAHTKFSSGKELDILGTEQCPEWPEYGAGWGVEYKR